MFASEVRGLAPVLSERTRRLWGTAEAEATGHGGHGPTIARVSVSTALPTLSARCVRPSFILVIRGIRVVRMFSIFIRAFLRALLIDLSQILSRRGLDARGLGQAGEKLAVALAVSRRTMLRMAAFASSVVASTPSVLPSSAGGLSPGSSTPTRRLPGASCNRTVDGCERRMVRRDQVRSRGIASTANRLGRQAISRSESMPSK